MKTTNNKTTNRIIFFVVLIWLAIIAILVFSSCSPGRMVADGYLVSVQQNRKKLELTRTGTAAEADSFILNLTGIQVDTESMIGTDKPYWDMKNGKFYLYIERQGFYKRSEKDTGRWRVYDEKLIENGELRMDN